MAARLSRPLAIVLLGATWGGLTVAREQVRAGNGLWAQYFQNAALTPPRQFLAADATPGTDAMRAQWGGQTPPAFSVRWSGYLTVEGDGAYLMDLWASGRAQLFIDDRLAVTNPGGTPPTSTGNQLRLEAGAHRVSLEFTYTGSAPELKWRMQAAGGAFQEVPWWRLSRRPASGPQMILARLLRIVQWTVALAIAVLLAIVVWTRGVASARGERPFAVTWRHRAVWLAVFVGLAVLETWPLASNPAHFSRNDNHDTMFNEWTMAWMVHQAVTDPGRLFDANIFHPAPNVLAYSAVLVVQSAFAAPVLLLGGSPVLAYNLVLLAGLALSGWAMCLLVARWTRDWPAGASAGILYAFSAAQLTRLPHIQAQHVEFIPPMLWALDRLMREPRWKHGLRLAGWYTLQALTSYYLLVITGVGLAAAVVARWDAWRLHGRRIALVLALAAAVSLVLLSPLLYHYWIARTGGLSRPFSAQLPSFWRDYFTTPSHVGQALLAPLTSSTGLFPGFGGLALTAVAIGTGVLKDGRARMLAAAAICGVALSFGPDLPGYRLLNEFVLPLQGLRAPARFGVLLTVAVAVLGGMGVAALRQRLRRPVLIGAITLLIPAWLVVESLAAPLWLRRFDGIPAIYGQLRDQPDAVVAELPMPPGAIAQFNAPYMLNSTVNFYKLINGYSGFVPATYTARAERLASFPSPDAVEALREWGVSHIFVHREQLGDRNAALDALAGLETIAHEGTITLFALQSWPATR